MDMYKTVREFTPDSLFAGNEIVVIPKGGYLASGQGVLLRGTVLCRDDEGKYKKVADATDVPEAVLTDSTVVGEEDVISTFYISGMFNKDALIFGEGVKFEDFELELKKINIYAKTVQEA